MEDQEDRESENNDIFKAGVPSEPIFATISSGVAAEKFSDFKPMNDEIEVVQSNAWSPSRINSLFPVEDTQESIKENIKVLITHENVPAIAIKKLKSKFHVVILNKSDTQEQILEKVHGTEAIFLWGKELKLDKDLLDFIGDKLKVVGLMSVGYDHVNVRQLVKRNIKISNTRTVISDSVAEVAICLALTVAHRFKEGYLQCIKGKWEAVEPDYLLGKQLSGSVCGIVGLGDIGSSIANRLVPFNIKRIIYSGHGRKLAAEDSSAEFVEFPVLLADSDFIFITCPLTDETQHLFDYSAFKQLKCTCVIVNVGRGGIIKTEDLVKALQEKLIWGAGLDVTDPEPLPLDHPLLHMENCFITPHIGSATTETRDKMALLTADNIIAALEGTPMPTEVCFKNDTYRHKSNDDRPRRTPARHTLTFQESYHHHF